MSENLFLTLADFRLLACLNGQERWLERVQMLRSHFRFCRRIELVLFDNVRDLSNYLGTPVPDWVTGTYWGNQILLLDPKSWIDPHIAEFGQILVHELTHIVIGDLTGGRCPLWLNEGLAMFYADQIHGMDLDEGCFEKEDVYDLNYTDAGLYNICANLIKALLDDYGLDPIVHRLTPSLAYFDDPMLGRDAMKRVLHGLREQKMGGMK